MSIPPLMTFQEDFLSGKLITKEYVHFSEIDCPELDIWIGRVVRSISLEFLHEILFTILSELLVNGCKANGKRVFFSEQGLDLWNEKDYARGISLYKDEFGHHRKRVFSSLEKSNYSISLSTIYKEDFIEFRVRNNAKILPEEKNRIVRRVQASTKYKNINDAYRESVDNEESSGLGIVLIHILLRNSGIPNQFFELVTGEDFTEVIIRIPKQLIPKDSQSRIRDLLIREVNSLPPLPAQINKLILIAKKKDVTFQEIATEAEKDPAIAAEIIKIANSPLFGVHKSIVSVFEGVKRIGLKNLESIFLALGAKKILNSRYAKQVLVWTHSFKTSMYVKFLLEEKRKHIQLLETATIAALLHDLGRMVLLSLDLSQVNQIRVLRSDDNTEISEWVEEYTVGTTHSEIGYLISDKWHFPEEILDVIRFHHKPWQCKSRNNILCQIIYLADILANIGKGKGNYFTVEPEVLDYFEIHSEKDFREMQDRFKVKFEEHREEYQNLFI
ncbi:signal transduction protein [Leptospira ellinghausenii]|uniref:Signal transduction protein n=1 Tax=Leptospira ellinghausenii TaxID=1917822 RepID=A0A2P2DHZ6_9LEPT|nr:HDOD domain-containing protein [Leptospira ellinghausenii]GBF44228.1 signal transduction protein [Leptospira ellinghausenii]